MCHQALVGSVGDREQALDVRVALVDRQLVAQPVQPRSHLGRVGDPGAHEVDHHALALAKQLLDGEEALGTHAVEHAHNDLALLHQVCLERVQVLVEAR